MFVSEINMKHFYKQEKNIISGSTALHMAAYYGKNDVVEMLLKAKADTNIKDRNGHTAIHVSIDVL